MKGFEKERAMRDMQKNLSKKRYQHSLRVAKMAEDLAKIHGVDSKKAYIAGLFHDFAKNLPNKESTKYLTEINIKDRLLLSEPNLAHGKIAAYILEKDYNLRDKSILSAIDKHTFGSDNMSELDKIIYIADAIEPDRSYQAVSFLRNLAKTDLNLTCLEYLKNNFKFLTEKNKQIHTQSVDMYNAILERGTDGF